MPNSNHDNKGQFSSGGGGGSGMSTGGKSKSGKTYAAHVKTVQSGNGNRISLADAAAVMYGHGSKQHLKALANEANDKKKAAKMKKMRSDSVSITKAVGIAADLADTEFAMAIDQARELGLSQVEIITVDTDGDDDGLADLYVARPTSIMVAWSPNDWQAERFAVPGGLEVDDIHLTVLYLGDAANFDTDQQRTIIGVVSQVAATHKRLYGNITGFGRFLEPNDNDENPIWLGVEAAGLRELRDDLVNSLHDAGIEWEDTYPDYVPHITLAYIDAEAQTPQVIASPDPICIDNLNVFIGGLEYEIELEEYDVDAEMNAPLTATEPARNMYYPVVLSKNAQVLDDEKRYSYGAWNVPNSVDAHGEWADVDTVQKALWDYVDRGNRDIHLQHMDDIVAGRWVELATVPFPVNVPVEIEPGILRKHTYPAGTPFMGVIWEPWAWPLVKSGELSGFSVGGTAQRIEAEFDQAALAKALETRPKV